MASKNKDVENIDEKVSGEFSATPGLEMDEGTVSIEVIDSLEDIEKTPETRKVGRPKKEKEFEEVEDEEDKLDIQDVESMEDVDKINPDEFEEVKEDEEDRKVTKKVEEKKTPVKDEKSDTPFKVFAKLLGDQGIIDYSDETFEDSDDYLFNKVKEQIESGIGAYKESLPPKVKEIIDNYEEGIPLGNFLEREATIDDYKAYSDEKVEGNELLQKSLLRNYYAIKGISEAAIEKKISRFETTGILADEAKEARDEIVEILNEEKKLEAEQVKVQRQERVKQYNTWLDSLKKDIDTRQEVIPGFKLNSKQKEKLYNGITKFDQDGKNEVMKAREKDPDFDLKVAYLATVINWDFSAFEKNANTKASKNLRDMLDNADRFGGSSAFRTEGTTTNKKADLSVMQKALDSLGKK